jgi:hypothetical protein
LRKGRFYFKKTTIYHQAVNPDKIKTFISSLSVFSEPFFIRNFYQIEIGTDKDMFIGILVFSVDVVKIFLCFANGLCKAFQVDGFE